MKKTNATCSFSLLLLECQLIMAAERHLMKDLASFREKAKEHNAKLSIVSGTALLTSAASICLGAGPVAGFFFLPEIVRQGLKMDKARFQSESIESRLREA